MSNIPCAQDWKKAFDRANPTAMPKESEQHQVRLLPPCILILSPCSLMPATCWALR